MNKIALGALLLLTLWFGYKAYIEEPKIKIQVHTGPNPFYVPPKEGK